MNKWNSVRLQLMITFGQFNLRISRILWVAVTVFSVCSVALAIWLSQFSIHDGYWIANVGDDYANMYKDVESIESSTNTSVVLIGSSALREAITTPDELEFERSDLNWHILTAGDLFPVEIAQVVSELPDDMIGTLMLEVSLRALSVSKMLTQQLIIKPRLPYQNWRFQKSVIRLGYSPSLEVSRLAFYLSRWDMTFPSHVPKERWWFHQVELISTSSLNWQKRVDNKRTMLEQLPANLESNLNMYKQIVSLAPPNMNVVFVSSPRNPAWINAEHDEKLWTVYEQALADLSSLVSYPIIQIEQGVEVEHFLDHGHIQTLAGRRIATANLLDAISELNHE